MNFLEIIESTDQNAIKEALSQRFKKNFAYFQNTQPMLVKFLQKKAENFAITVDSAGINIVNIKNGQLVYGNDASGHKYIAASKMFAEDPYSPPNWKVHHNDMDLYTINEKFRLTGKYANKIKESFMADERFMSGLFHMPSRLLPSLSFFGLGGGLFIEYLLEKYDRVSSIFIYEPDSDFFTISCYFVDFERLFEMSIYKGVSIFVGGELPNNLAKEFFATQKITAGFIRLELGVYEDEQILRAKKIFELAQNSCIRGWGTYEDEMIGYKNQLKNIDLDKPSIPILSKPININAPVCVVGNGASLDGLLSFLKLHQDNMIIISCGTSIRTLLKNGIKPDFQVEIERTDNLHTYMSEAGYHGEIPVIAANVVDPKTLALSNQPLLFFRDFTSGTYIKDARVILHFASPYVGNAGLNIALSFSDTVFLCGVDVGYKAGKIHSKDSIYEEDEEKLPEGSVEVRPNFDGDKMYSNALYNLSKENLERAINFIKPQKVYNLSDGAYIEGAIPMRAEKLKLKPIKKDTKIRMIKKSFSTNTNEIFKNDKKADVIASMMKIRATSLEILGTNVQSKHDLFVIFDRFATKLEEFYMSDMTATLLLSGSLRHIAFNSFMAFIHISSDDIGSQYQTFLKTFTEAADALISDFISSDTKGRVADMIFNKIKAS